MQKLEQDILENKSETEEDHKPSKFSKEAILQTMSDKDREFVEQMDEEYFTRVKTSDDFYRRKKLILMNLDRLQAKVEPLARSYDDYKRLKFIML